MIISLLYECIIINNTYINKSQQQFKQYKTDPQPWAQELKYNNNNKISLLV